MRRLRGILLLLLIILVPYLWVSYLVDPQARRSLGRMLS